MSALAARLPILLTLLLAIVMIAALGWQGYQAWQAEQQAAAESRADNGGTQVQTNQVPDIDVAEVELFGSAATATDTQEVDTENLPETNLRLYLRGVMAAEGDFPGSALIEDANAKTEAYLVGDELPGNAKLRSVHPNRVIIDRSGKLENLYFPELTESEGMEFSEEAADSAPDTAPDSRTATATSPPPIVTTPAASEQRREEIRRRLEELRERLRNNGN